LATYVKFQPFVEYMAEKVYDLSADTLKVALSDTAPTNTDSVLLTGSSHPPPASTNGYAAGGSQATQSSSAQTAGTYKLVLADVVFTAAAGTIGPFRYTILYDDTPTSPADPLICYHDYGSSITLADTETFTWDADATTGILTIA
jgi:hypothetical protein